VTAHSPPIRIDARTDISAPAHTLYAFLAALENHWLLTDRFVSLVCLHGPVSSRSGGEIIIRGPWGLHRHARPWLEADDQPERLAGTALVGRRTVAHVTWALTPVPGGTAVELAASILEASVLDRALLLVASSWLRRRFLAVIVRLEELVVGAPRKTTSVDLTDTGQTRISTHDTWQSF
jgi:hypothetical protein